MALRFATPTLLIIAATASALSPPLAHAALGGDAASILADTAELHGTVNDTPLQQYDIQEINNDSGMRVREFVNRDGLVFAVTWSGAVVPNLKSLLGASYPSYIDAVSARRQLGAARSLRIASTDLVVESGGHMRAYRGRAYLPALLPAGMSIADLR